MKRAEIEAKARENMDVFMVVVNGHRELQQSAAERIAWLNENNDQATEVKRQNLVQLSAVEAQKANGKKKTDEIKFEEGNPLKGLPEGMFATTIAAAEEKNLVILTEAVLWEWMLNFTLGEIRYASGNIGDMVEVWLKCVNPASRYLACMKSMNVVYMSRRYRKHMNVVMALLLARKKLKEKEAAGGGEPGKGGRVKGYERGGDLQSDDEHGLMTSEV